MRCQGLTALDSGLVGRRRWRLLVVGGGLYASRVGFRAVLEEGRWHRGRGVWGWRGLRRGRSVRRRRWRGLRGRSVRGRRWRGRCRWAGARAGARARRRRTPLPVGRGERRRGGVVPAAVRLLGLQGQAQEEQGHQESGFATRHSLTPSRTAMFLARSVWL
uniref:Uncharacterized protein n=1 Tax=Aegilops tauschii subsp. strangulata TaxID=200361 RepID=A0A453NDA2_AEGTS